MQFLHWQQAIHLGRKSIWHFQCPLSQNTTEGVGFKHRNIHITCIYIHIAMVLPVVGAMEFWSQKRDPNLDILPLLLWTACHSSYYGSNIYKMTLASPSAVLCPYSRTVVCCLAWGNKLSDTSRRYSNKINPWLERITEKSSSNSQQCLALAKRSSHLKRAS